MSGGDAAVSALIQRALDAPRSPETTAGIVAEAERLLDRDDLSRNSRAFLEGLVR